jgi:poly-beta-hydroxyalkanoate depolymerase
MAFVAMKLFVANLNTYHTALLVNTCKLVLNNNDKYITWSRSSIVQVNFIDSKCDDWSQIVDSILSK